MLFLVGIYSGARDGSTEYVRHQNADLWVSRPGTDNLVRSTSFIGSRLLDYLAFHPGIESVSPLLRIIVSGSARDRPVTLFLFGFDPEAPLGAPHVVEGTLEVGNRGLIIDRAFALKNELVIGDSVRVDREAFVIRGISDDTNALVAQFAFTRLEDAQEVIGLEGVVGYGLLRLEAGTDPREMAEELEEAWPELSFIVNEDFVRNNVDELESGVLPILWTIAVLGLLVCASLLSLLLYGSVLEQREDYAVLKAIGIPHSMLVVLVLRQSLLLVSGGFLMGVLAFAAGRPPLLMAVPELIVALHPPAILGVLAATLLTGLIGSMAPVARLAQVYPGEVFRA